jgi:hypothetical protein
MKQHFTDKERIRYTLQGDNYLPISISTRKRNRNRLMGTAAMLHRSKTERFYTPIALPPKTQDHLTEIDKAG